MVLTVSCKSGLKKCQASRENAKKVPNLWVGGGRGGGNVHILGLIKYRN